MVWGNYSSTRKYFIRIISKLSNDKVCILFWQTKKWLYISLDSPPLLSHPLSCSVLIPKLHYLLLHTVIITFLGKNTWSLQKWFWLHNRRLFFEEGKSIKNNIQNFHQSSYNKILENKFFFQLRCQHLLERETVLSVFSQTKLTN